MVPPPFPTGVSLQMPLYPLPMGVRLRYLQVVLGLECFLHLEYVACRGLTTGLRFAPAAHWWGGLSVPWIIGTTDEFYSMPLSLDRSALMPRYPPPLSPHPASPVLLQGRLKPLRQHPAFSLVSSSLPSQCRPLVFQIPGCV